MVALLVMFCEWTREVSARKRKEARRLRELYEEARRARMPRNEYERALNGADSDEEDDLITYREDHAANRGYQVSPL